MIATTIKSSNSEKPLLLFIPTLLYLCVEGSDIYDRRQRFWFEEFFRISRIRR